jgi:heme/copper-type cytochrome/quinol oxidase subunit 2
VALACPICFQVEENATTDGVQAAVLVLVGVTTVVLGAFARFVAGFARRERRQSKDPEC